MATDATTIIYRLEKLQEVVEVLETFFLGVKGPFIKAGRASGQNTPQ